VQFILEGGLINGKSILPESWIREATTPRTGISTYRYGYQWWIPDDTGFEAIGIMGQSIFIDPKRKLVIVAQSAWPKVTIREYREQYTAFRLAVAAELDKRQGGRSE
jgi:CubicO group peptidase (beta-lactamase class C family)